MQKESHHLEGLRRETLAELELTQELLAELDALEFTPSRPVELVLQLRERLRRREWKVLTEQCAAAASIANAAVAGRSAPQEKRIPDALESYEIRDLKREESRRLTEPLPLTAEFSAKPQRTA